MSEFTEGKWFSVKSEMKAGKHRRTKIYCSVSREDGTLKTIATLSGTTAETKANACLITSAPEMYELLYEALQELKGYDPISNGISTVYPYIEELLARIDGEKGRS